MTGADYRRVKDLSSRQGGIFLAARSKPVEAHRQRLFPFVLSLPKYEQPFNSLWNCREKIKLFPNHPSKILAVPEFYFRFLS
ncbi:MAG: hypothetical protein LBD67_08190 [Candidatus Accumulibacter sp.]|jgi:hypothetical protein|nr:hypothetical protein [Accumulibacter sp.]